MRRRYDCETPHKRRLLSVSLASMLAVLAVCPVVNPAPAGAQEVVGAARIVKNNVTGSLPLGEPLLLSNGKDVFQTEVIDTAANSSTLLGFQDNTQLAICPSAHVTLQSVNLTRSELVIFVASGCIRFSSGELLKTALFNTPSAQIRTYGTIVTVTVSARGATTVSVAEGTASVTGAGRTVTVAAGQSTLVLRGQPPTPPVPTPPEPPIVTEMDRLLTTASKQDFGTRAAARSPEVEAPHSFGMFTPNISPNIDGKIQSQIARDAKPAAPSH
jgi:hypothetical protein